MADWISYLILAGSTALIFFIVGFCIQKALKSKRWKIIAILVIVGVIAATAYGFVWFNDIKSALA